MDKDEEGGGGGGGERNAESHPSRALASPPSRSRSQSPPPPSGANFIGKSDRGFANQQGERDSTTTVSAVSGCNHLPILPIQCIICLVHLVPSRELGARSMVYHFAEHPAPRTTHSRVAHGGIDRDGWDGSTVAQRLLVSSCCKNLHTAHERPGILLPLCSGPRDGQIPGRPRLLNPSRRTRELCILEKGWI